MPILAPVAERTVDTAGEDGRMMGAGVAGSTAD